MAGYVNDPYRESRDTNMIVNEILIGNKKMFIGGQSSKHFYCNLANKKALPFTFILFI